MQIENNPETGDVRIFDMNDDEMEVMMEFVRNLGLSNRVIIIKNGEVKNGTEGL